MPPLHALIVDDDPADLLLMSTIIERLGFTVEKARNGREALEKMTLHTYHLMVLDLVMPEMDGFALLERLREDGSDLLGKTVVVSRLDRDAVIDRLDVCRFLQKPHIAEGLEAFARHCSGVGEEKRD